MGVEFCKLAFSPHYITFDRDANDNHHKHFCSQQFHFSHEEYLTGSSSLPIFCRSCGFFPSFSDPLQSVLKTLERQYKEEKHCALERQREMYEQELQQLRKQLSPDKPSHLQDPAGLLSSTASAAAATSPGSHRRVRRWSEDR